MQKREEAQAAEAAKREASAAAAAAAAALAERQNTARHARSVRGMLQTEVEKLTAQVAELECASYQFCPMGTATVLLSAVVKRVRSDSGCQLS
jgi:hypothetical protein